MSVATTIAVLVIAGIAAGRAAIRARQQAAVTQAANRGKPSDVWVVGFIVLVAVASSVYAWVTPHPDGFWAVGKYLFPGCAVVLAVGLARYETTRG